MSLNPSCKYYFACDISMNKPGFAVIRVQNRRAELVESFHIKVNTKLNRPQRFEYIETTLAAKLREIDAAAIRFDAVVRESFASPNPDTCATMFGAWASVDRALWSLGYEVTEKYAQQTVKKHIGGHGRCDKTDVERGVRDLLGLPAGYVFGSNDESDACGIGLTHLLKEDLI